MAVRHRIGFLALLLWTAAGCANSALQPWHTARLGGDFEAGDKSVTWPDYLLAEQRAFDEVDSEIYSKVATGSENALNRYSRGSASDPETFPQNYNRTYELRAESPRGGALLLHGMSDSPYSLWSIAAALNEAGLHVVNLRLPGHGTAPAALTSVSWQDFAAAAELAMEHLEDEVGPGPIHLVGFSNGAPIAVNYALDALKDTGLPQVASLILITPAIGVSSAASLAGFKNLLGGIPGLEGLRYSSIRPEFEPFRYGSFPTNGATQTYRLTRRINRAIGELERSGRAESMPPVFVITSAVDATVSNEAIIDRLLGRLPDNGNELLLFDVNRLAIKSSLIVENPGPFTHRVVDAPKLPFAVTLVQNESSETSRVVAATRPAHSAEFNEPVPLGESWPLGVASLSHIALTFAPDDALYGRYPPDDESRLFLGAAILHGERGILRVPDSWFTRQRYNPFYDYMEARIVDWCAEHGEDATGPAVP